MAIPGTKISAYPDGGAPQTGDKFVIARAGANFGVLGSELDNGWQTLTHGWTRTGDHTFAVAGDLTSVYEKGVKVRYKDGGAFEYGVVARSTFASPNTNVVLITNSDYALAAVPITDRAISRGYLPVGFPDWFAYAPTLTGFSVAPTGAIYRWRTSGRQLEVMFRQNGDGTSNATTFTISLPVVAVTITSMAWAGAGLCSDNGAVLSVVSRILVSSAGSTASVFANPATATFTASGGKRILHGSVAYEY